MTHSSPTMPGMQEKDWRKRVKKLRSIKGAKQISTIFHFTSFYTKSCRFFVSPTGRVVVRAQMEIKEGEEVDLEVEQSANPLFCEQSANPLFCEQSANPLFCEKLFR